MNNLIVMATWITVIYSLLMAAGSFFWSVRKVIQFKESNTFFPSDYGIPMLTTLVFIIISICASILVR